MRVYKYPFRDGSVVRLPYGAQALHVSIQEGTFNLWAAVDPSRDTVPWRVHILATGFDEIPEDAAHVGTVLQDGGVFVWHVFLERDKAA